MDVMTIPRTGEVAVPVLTAPPSKSVTNRALVLAALARGPSTLERVLRADDIDAMERALQHLGARIEKPRDSTMEIEGTRGVLRVPHAPLDVGASGTALRFLTAIGTLIPGPVTITGDRRLCERPMADLVIALRRLGVAAVACGGRGRPPIHVPGGGFPGGTVRMSGRVSSQFISALLMIGPLGRSDLHLTLRGRPASSPYIGLTVDLVRRFGGEVVVHPGGREFHVRAGRGYQGRDILIEGDASNASYFFALAAMLGQCITIENLPAGSQQGDLRFVDLLGAMGCRVERGANSMAVQGGDLRGIEADMMDLPDLVPTLAVAALWAQGRTIIRNVAHLRMKESDRLSALARELAKVGAAVQEERDGLVIDPARARTANPAVIATYGDHRIAMSFAILGTVRGGVAIENPACVVKSYPAFFSDLALVTGRQPLR